MSHVTIMSISLFEFLKWPLLDQKFAIWPPGVVGQFFAFFINVLCLFMPKKYFGGYFGHIRVISLKKNLATIFKHYLVPCHMGIKS